MTPRQQSTIQNCTIRKWNHLYRGLTGIIFVIALIGCPGCSPDVNNKMPDNVEMVSVWQYLKKFSIYQDRIKDSPFLYSDPVAMFNEIADTLHNVLYTCYIDSTLEYTDKPYKKTNGIQGYSSVKVSVFPLTDSVCLLQIKSFMNGWEYVDGSWVYADVYKEFTNAFSEIKKYSAVIVDLRNNGGGDLEVTDMIIEDMLPAGISYLRSKERTINENKARTVDSVWMTKRAGRSEFSNKKFAVLIDEHSASASEVLLLALKDGLHAPVFGMKSYGKGIGQIHLTRRDRPWMRISFVHFYRLDGTDYHRVGISPDITTARDSTIYYAVKTLQPSVQKEQINYPTLMKYVPDETIGGMYKVVDERELTE